MATLVIWIDMFTGRRSAEYRRSTSSLKSVLQKPRDWCLLNVCLAWLVVGPKRN